MVKDTKKNNQKKGNSQKNGKVLEVEDFFTSFLAKKVRNINKKLQHIKELEGLKKDELKKDQQEMIARKPELLAQIDENNAIKNMYLEAYSKKGEYEATTDQAAPAEQQNVVAQEVKQVDNSAQLAEVARDADNKAVNRVTESLSKLVVVTGLFNQEASVEQFAEESGLNSGDLSNLHDMHNQLVTRGSNNDDHHQYVLRTFREYAEGQAVRGTDNKSMSEISNLVDEVLRNQAFANFVPKAPVVVVKSEPVVAIQEQPQVVEVKAESRKQSEVAARKDSEAQQQFFMQDDSEDEQEVREEPAPVAQANVTVTESENKQAPAEEKKQEKKSSGDDDEEEWHTAARGGRQYDGAQNPNYRGNNRGRGGRGRGNNRGGYKRDGEKREPRLDKDGNPIPYEKRQFDGEKRPYTRGDGERGRGERGRGGRGRGGRGRYNKDGERRPFDGEKKAYRKQNTDGTPAEGAPLKEVGTLDQPQAKVENTEAQE